LSQNFERDVVLYYVRFDVPWLLAVFGGGQGLWCINVDCMLCTCQMKCSLLWLSFYSV